MTPERVKIYGNTLEAHLTATAPKGTDMCVLALGDRDFQDKGDSDVLLPATLQRLHAQYLDGHAALEKTYLINVREILTMVNCTHVLCY